MKNGTFDNTLMFLASPQLRYEMSQIHVRHPVVTSQKKLFNSLLHDFLENSGKLNYLLSTIIRTFKLAIQEYAVCI